MKKTYQIPATLVTHIEANGCIMQASTTPDISIGNERKSSFDVKEQRQSDYNVWKDDWSE